MPGPDELSEPRVVSAVTAAEVEAHIGPLVEDDILDLAITALPGLGLTARDDHITKVSVYRR